MCTRILKVCEYTGRSKLHVLLELSFNTLIVPSRQVGETVKGLALDALLEVARGNEIARREFGERGCIEHLLPLIRNPLHCAKALECLWMLCFESPENIARVLGRFRGRCVISLFTQVQGPSAFCESQTSLLNNLVKITSHTSQGHTASYISNVSYAHANALLNHPSRLPTAGLGKLSMRLSRL